MTGTSTLLALVLSALPLAAVGTADTAPTVAPPQAVGNLYANWADGETWSRYLDATGETEVGLGLQPAGKSGTMFLAFSARWSGRNATGVPKDIFVQVGAPQLVNPLVLRTPTLTFVIDPPTKNKTILDLSSRLTVDKPGPGQIVSNGIGKIEPKELAQIARATTLEGTILGVDVEYRAAQRQAIRAFAQKISVR